MMLFFIQIYLQKILSSYSSLINIIIWYRVVNYLIKLEQ
jgi:hypothetical protein